MIVKPSLAISNSIEFGKKWSSPPSMCKGVLGQSYSPTGTNGPIGKGQKSLDKRQGTFIRFQRIQNNLPETDHEILKGHADLLPLYDFVDGIAKGQMAAYLEHKNPVPIHRALVVAGAEGAAAPVNFEHRVHAPVNF